DLPGGPGVRIDTHAYDGYSVHPGFDSLLMKVVVASPGTDFSAAVRRLRRALAAVRVDGVETNTAVQTALADRPEIESGVFTTTFVPDHTGELATAPAGSSHEEVSESGAGPGLAGAELTSDDPLAVLDYGRSAAVDEGEFHEGPEEPPDGSETVPAPLQGTIVAVLVEVGDEVAVGRELVVMEAMKMQHAVTAPISGVVTGVTVQEGQAVMGGHTLLTMAPGDVEAGEVEGAEAVDPNYIRPDLHEVIRRHGMGLDEARPEAVERRHAKGHRTARENLADICDEGTFVEYAPLVVAAQRKRRSLEELIVRTPADGMIAGIGEINGELFEPDRSRAVIVLYDYTVLAGTQGHENHRKKDRIFSLADQRGLPVVLFAEGGGGRPGDTDGVGIAGLDGPAFHLFARLSGRVPLVGITTGFCFAGNAALLGCCDVIIATDGSNIGMGGPAMIEGGGLGVFRPEEVGPMSDQVPNGVVDIAVADEAEAVEVARRYLSYFQGPLVDWEAPDQRLLRQVVPEDRLRAYDIHAVIEGLADVGSILELRPTFGPGMVTCLIRIEGRPMGVMANNPKYLAGAIDSDGADKASRFMALCDAFDLPILSLCDTPGIMVGPEVERTALVRHASRMFVTGAGIGVPFMTIVTRKGYGLGAMAMAGGGFRTPLFTVAWPTGEFGGMGLEGAVKLGYRRDLEAVADPAERRALYEEMVQRMYDHGKALSAATHFEIDDVIDPADSRRWILSALTPPLPDRDPPGRRRPFVDTW
ncbi:MAG TPA: carbamoyl-phosphate synthase large subunit, partial [Acidimicrobiales bacterium]|nr:carbamoyl-phosphate synthase large subunit [Acidimicrobiales bacterium]